MKLDVTETKRRNITGRRIVGFTAALGDLSADGKTPAEARDGLAKLLRRESEWRPLESVPIPLPGKTTHAIVSRAFRTDWEGVLISPADGTPLKRTNTTRDALLDQLRLEACQIAWQPGQNAQSFALHLPERLHGDWFGWVEFQERFERARKMGYDHNDAHSIAGRNPAWNGAFPF